MQVKHIEKRPVILLGDMFGGLVDWLKTGPLDAHLMDQSDFDQLIVARDVADVMRVLEPEITAFQAAHKNPK